MMCKEFCNKFTNKLHITVLKLQFFLFTLLWLIEIKPQRMRMTVLNRLYEKLKPVFRMLITYHNQWGT